MNGIRILCPACGGRRWRYVARAGVLYDRMLSLGVREPCPHCAEAGRPEAGAGRPGGEP
ncbi:hypothetical protein [Allonocardiopsis opalescens]|uniref:Uncharacterized protein n=1 Tax=Allonocardiopsis opalescens TaxID=1144618 RepID=A0A2T0QDU8_9ACTN|nr:hypothetical protein [Allonocardiopsis opalescens]PRY02023.1 hypothetical protein CLV72_101621 [Allonocardiopsis opalescens]